MTYDNLWRITSKQQSLYQNGVIANGQLYSGYHLNYDYQTETPGHHFQLESIYDEHYRSNTGVNGQRQTRHRFNYDDNGNLIYESTARMRADGQYDERMQERRLLWDEENRLLALSENGYVSNYFYDADGERTIKMHGANSAVFADGLLINDSTNYNRFVLYVNPFFTVTSDSLYYRHIYMGGERFLTQVGKYYNLFGNFENNSSMAGNSFNTDYAGVYQGKWQTLCDVYWQRYDSLGVTHNGVEPPVSKSAGYVQQGRLTDPGEENGIMTRSSDGSYSSNEDEGYLIEPEDELEQSAEDDESELSEDDSVASEDETDEPLGLGSDTESMDLSPIPLRQSIFVAADGPAESYYYHKDHLGSSSIITKGNGEVTQRIEYLPYGEVFLEKQYGNHSLPYRFNGKELDEETGLYYYGARYYDPRMSMWYGTDPMQGKYPGISTYAFCHNNPINTIDPCGCDTVNLLPPYQMDSRTYNLKMDIKHFDDDPSVINIWAHGLEDGIGIKDGSTGNDIKTAQEFIDMLQQHSEVWQKRKDNDPVTIVLHSCETSSFAYRLSKDKRFRNVTIIAPNRKLQVRYVSGERLFVKNGMSFHRAQYLFTGVCNDASPNYEDYYNKTGHWLSYKNGVLTAKYSGRFKRIGEKSPGSMGFRYNIFFNLL
jgi:RHS repeat-associated protein